MRTPVKLPGPMPTATPRASAAGARLAQQRIDVLEQRRGARDPLAEHLAVVDEALVATSVAVSNARISIRDRYNAASAPSSTIACGRPRARADPSAPAAAPREPASGHSTKTIASSK